MAKVDPGRRGMHRHSPYWWAKLRSKQHGTRAPRIPVSTDTHQQVFFGSYKKILLWKYQVKNIKRIIKLWLVYVSSMFMKMQLCVCVTCSFVSTDVKQASAPVSSRLRDGGNGCCGDTEAGLCEYWVRCCRDIIWHPVIFTSNGEAHHFLILKYWYWAISDW